MSSTQDAFLAMLRPQQVEPTLFRSAVNEANPTGRIYGGQLMAQAVAAGLGTIAEDRLPSSLQITFMAGPRPELPLDYEVRLLQDGKRLSSRLVDCRQSGRSVAIVLLSAQVPAPERHHEEMGSVPSPEQGIPLSALDDDVRARLAPPGFLAMESHPHVEARLADVTQLGRRDKVEIWLRLRHALPAAPRLHAAALAYLSDWWLSLPGVGPYLAEQKFYMATLNHSLWFHGAPRASDWLLLHTASDWASESRGVCRGRIYTSAGTLVASAVQDCLQTSFA